MTRLFKHAALGAIAVLALAAPALAALKVGARAPDFSAPAFLAGEPHTFSLAEARRKGPVVVYFFPAAYTAGCNLEAHQFSEAVDDFKAQGVSVIGVTAGNVDRLKEFSKDTEACGGRFPVAADPNAAIARRCDALLTAKPGWSNRTSYLVSSSGAIVAVHSDLNPARHVRAMLDAAKSLRK
jgi:peroxiredoxin